jgi:hypothetical protein
VPESVLNRGVALRRPGSRIESPVREVVRQQQFGEVGLERDLLRALLRAPQAIDLVRQRMSPEDFHDPACRALALWLWAGHAGLPSDQAAEPLARELALGDPGALDWNAEAEGAAHRMVLRRLVERQRERMSRLKAATAQDEQTRLMKEIDEIARQLHELSQ